MFSNFILIQHHGAKNSRRQYELQMGEVKAHAAKISHAKRRQKKRQIANENSILRNEDDEDSLPKLKETGPLVSGSWALHEEMRKNVCPCPQLLIGQGKLDPFQSGQARELPPAMLQCLDHAFDVLWPKNAPALTGKLLENTVRAWRRQNIQSDLHAYAQICGAASLGQALTKDPAKAKLLSSMKINYQTQAIRLIHKEISSLTGPPSANLLTAIVQISVSGQPDLAPVIGDSLPKTPVYKAFNMELYERFIPLGQEEHYRAMAVLIKNRGSLDSLPPGLAHPILLEDVVRATHHIEKPLHPLPRLLAKQDFSPLLDAEAEDLLAELGSSFRFRPHHDRDESLEKLILQTAEFTAAVDQYHRNSPTRCPLSDLAARSIVIQHGVLCLPPAVTECAQGSFQPADQYYEIARLSLMLYVTMVIFPCVAAPLLRQHQSELLQKQLLLCFQHQAAQDPAPFSAGSDFNRLLLWSLLLGAIASPPTSETQEWYATQLGAQVNARDLTWDEFNDEVRSFLFWDYVMLGRTEDVCIEQAVF
ncbi:hypothetical protein H2200_009594 [Cladophialophora chaetospira]|uniref:Uncharacterized protein n=1 Tax=Cladophialophora chaetospira TaxID=386627 RepID=A0AA38X2T8_9EURO|nr:hypothetical protein H2200_009594 [Cladophialophora chaetospira]